MAHYRKNNLAMVGKLKVTDEFGVICGVESNGVISFYSNSLVQYRDGKIIQTESAEKAMLAVDRGYYSPNNSYSNESQKIGFGAKISPPQLHVYALELLKDHLIEGKKSLDVGSGLGYLTACMAIMVGPTGKALGIEHVPGLVDLSVENIRRSNPALLESGRVKFILGDGRKGHPEEAPFDAIHVGAAVPVVLPDLLDQLRPGGRGFRWAPKEGIKCSSESTSCPTVPWLKPTNTKGWPLRL